MEIPKLIHYCWFGKNPLPTKVQMCIQSWKKYCPDYKIILWNEENYDINKNKYIKDAYVAKKWAFVSDYVRLDVVYQYGGIYLDTDVELIRSCDELLSTNVFLAIEKQNLNINSGLGFGAVKGDNSIKALRDMYNDLSFLLSDGSYNLVACPEYITSFFKQKGYIKKDRTQKIGDVLILSSEYFCPIDYNTGIKNITANTIGIHWYDASWFEKSDKKIHEVEMLIRRKIPGKSGKILCFLYRKIYRLFEYTKSGTLFKKIREQIGEQ